MKALVYQQPGEKQLLEAPMPRLQHSCDAIVRITHTTICGTDLHILKGDVPEVAPGRILGHEGMGFVAETGPGVVRFKTGDPVLISCITACGRCDFCRRGMFSHCDSGGWQLGRYIDGTQAEFVRIPYADSSLYPVPGGAAPERIVMLSDVLPTGFECGLLSGCLEPGQSVAIVGAGPIGLGIVLMARLFSPSELIVVDTDDHRLQAARDLGATRVCNNQKDAAARQIMEWTGGRGVDLAIEAVGIPPTFELCTAIVAPGGHVANIGVHGRPVQLHLERLWAHNITLTTRLVDTISTARLLSAVTRGSLNPSPLVTHRFPLSNILEAYDQFGRGSETRTLKTIITP